MSTLPRRWVTSPTESVSPEATPIQDPVLSRIDLVLGTIVALGMGTAFTLMSSGLSLIVTFVPGVVFAWFTFAWLYVKKIRLPRGSAFLPVFFVALAAQFIHFAEEFTTGFRTAFPLLYGGVPYTDDLFVTFNMASYCAFTLASVLVFAKGIRFLLIPPLFFIVYGAIGNAIAHTWWSLYFHAYFPGLITAQAYWVLGPLVLYKLLGAPRAVVITTALFALVLIPLLTIFASPSAIGS
jgi:hypothetical protein